jgi:predicted anti-sigma-YlaC factor YlaD
VPADELTCKELVEVVTDYLEGSMAPEDRVRFEEHLVDCPGCSAYLDQMRETVRLSGALREEDLEPAARATLLDVFRDWKRGRRARV